MEKQKLKVIKKDNRSEFNIDEIVEKVLDGSYKTEVKSKGLRILGDLEKVDEKIDEKVEEILKGLQEEERGLEIDLGYILSFEDRAYAASNNYKSYKDTDLGFITIFLLIYLCFGFAKKSKKNPPH